MSVLKSKGFSVVRLQWRTLYFILTMVSGNHIIMVEKRNRYDDNRKEEGWKHGKIG